MSQQQGVTLSEQVGEKFTDAELLDAQARAWKALDEIAALLRPGHTEKDAAAFLKERLKANGAQKTWHPPQIRFGSNTTKTFGEKSEPGVALAENDLFFLDIGPVFGGHEGDVGRTYTIGTDPEHKRIADDAKRVFEATRAKWSESGLTGRELYDFAKSTAGSFGWELGFGGASGHRVSDFPHAVHYRGKLKTQDHIPGKNRWILEIHLFDREKRFGAFYEDLL